METMKQIVSQDQIIISTTSDQRRQLLPLNLIITLALGTLTGIAIIFGLFWGANMLIP